MPGEEKLEDRILQKWEDKNLKDKESI